ncbi:MAG: hypothetical protein Q6M04_11830 [Thermostichus sp. BF3_bins_97]
MERMDQSRCSRRIHLLTGLGLLVGSLAACRALPAPIPPETAQPNPIRRHISKDGTHFEASLGDMRALPSEFPSHLRLPNTSIVSSGQIRDRSGGITSLILQTSQPLPEITTYYRRTLWGRGWEILSDVEQPDGIRTLVFESPHRPQKLPQQAVIQVGSPRQGPDQSEHRDILILLSTVPEETPRAHEDLPPSKPSTKLSPSSMP